MVSGHPCPWVAQSFSLTGICKRVRFGLLADSLDINWRSQRTKAEADAIAEYKENNGDVDIRGARFVRLGFV